MKKNSTYKNIRSNFYYGSVESNKLGLKENSNKYDFIENKEDILNDAKNGDSSYGKISKQIKENSYVLDIGCSTGVIGFVLKEIKNCVVDGIEYDKDTYLIAKNRKIYNKIYNFSVCDQENSYYQKILHQEKKYDYVVFGDVLEHLYNPWDAILYALNLLKEDGKIIVSLPNISHLDIIYNLMSEDFNYNYVGLLDTTHIRFFTSNSFIDMINNVSTENKIPLKIELVDRTINYPAYIDELPITEVFKKSDEYMNFITLQNIFTISKSDCKSITSNIKNETEDLLSVLNDTYNSFKKQNDELKIELEKVKTEKNNYSRDYELMKSNYNEVINSKSWKIISKFRNIKNKLFGIK